MGYYISTIDNLPMLSGYYFLLVGKANEHGRICRTLYARFDEIAERIGVKSAIVKSFAPENINKEIQEAFVHAPWFRKIYDDLLYREPALIIMKPHPKEFKFTEDEFFALIPFATLEKIYLDENELVQDIVALAVEGSTKLMDKLMASEHKPGFFKRLGNAFILQPNFTGVGVDLKVLFRSNNVKCDYFIHGNNNL